MADQRQALTYNQTSQTVGFYPSESREGIPSSVTYSVFAAHVTDDQTAEFSGSGTVDSVSTTVDVASGFSTTTRNKVFLASTASIVVGRFYRLANTLSQAEIVKVTAIGTNDHVLVETDLQYDYGSGDTFRGLFTSFTVDSTFIADKTKLNDPDAPYRVVWSYTLNSIVRKQLTYFDVVRRAKKSSLTHFDLMEAWPDLWAEQPQATRGQAWANFLDAGEDRIYLDLKTRGIDPNQVRDVMVLNELHRSACYMIIAQQGTVPTGRDVEAYVQERMNVYATDLTNATNSMLVDQDKTGGITKEPIRQLLFKR